MSTGARVIPHVTCLGCGCACDDITATVRDGRITDVDSACELGRQWFGDGTVPSAIRSAGESVPLDRAIADSAALLAAARRPLVYLAPELSCETQRAAVSLADAARAMLDSVSSSTIAEALVAAQRRGRMGATLGEVRHRADLLLYWGIDPARRYQRFSSRFAPDPPGLFVGSGRSARAIIAIDIGDEYGPRNADLRVRVSPDEERSALAILRAIVLGRPLGDILGNDLMRRMSRVAEKLVSGRYVVIINDAEPAAHPRGDRADGLIALTEALNATTRAAMCSLRAGGNRAGADAVLTWQSGFPMSVDYARGAPRYRPEAGAMRLLETREVDLAVVIGAPRELPTPVQETLRSTRRVAVGPRVSESALASSDVAIDTGVPGIHENGMALRMDDLPLPLRQVVSGPLSTLDVIQAIERQYRSLVRGAGA
ncbi:MAG TPA: hypothetical protein VJ812_07680 [Gemmatimonadaceae bacterium]|jgi:formylmethanofuran dehydrogenase subunit B|nr:hypothetical protein [Gemmatimonadaceae bacterium]